MSHSRTVQCAKDGDPCPVTFEDSGRWAQTRAQEAGWFFQRHGDKAYCPDHNPPWVAAWRAGKDLG